MIKSITNSLPTVMFIMLKLPNELYPFKVDLENNIENTFTILSSYVFRFLKVYILDFSALLHNNHFQIQLVYISLLDYCLCKFLSIFCFCITTNFGQNIASKFSILISIGFILNFSSYTNADLKISLYVCIRVKIIPWKFRILNAKNARII